MPNLDIYKRTCTKAQQLWKEVDITQSDVDIEPDVEPEAGEEEQQLELPIEDELDCCKVMAELECMKRRILRLQLRLKTEDTCTEEPCVNPQLEISCSVNPEICELQKNHHKLQCQINELIRCCNVAKDQIEDLRARLCQKSREILELQKAVCLLEAWRNTLQHEFGVCYERFQYLKHVKAEWEDVEQKIDEQKHCYQELEKNFVPKKCFLNEKRQFVDETTQMRELLQEMFQIQTARFDALERRMESVEVTMAAPDIASSLKQASKEKGNRLSRGSRDSRVSKGEK
ncbi:uncharacterized protein LOC101450987 [Ceratitis capitata]|uniref:uncharacterized protein LOC101450987 n=1 Tax=Ceratitis capitata TaxID=7213 RepID=UPI00032A2F26|nr:uncharacterized protein LOC101450987 [Ceratitis capitata]